MEPSQADSRDATLTNYAPYTTARVCDVNPWIKRNQHYRTMAPCLQDVIAAVPLCSHMATTVLKLDVTKAHRCSKVMQTNWKHMTAKIKGAVWVNKVGSCGIASAQYHWGRMAALKLRMLHYTFPQILLVFVFIDDFAIIVPQQNAAATTMGIVCFLHALGLPISRKKTAKNTPKTWLGYLIDTLNNIACLTSDKQTTILHHLTAVIEGRVMDLDSVQKTAGRLNW